MNNNIDNKIPIIQGGVILATGVAVLGIVSKFSFWAGRKVLDAAYPPNMPVINKAELSKNKKLMLKISGCFLLIIGAASGSSACALAAISTGIGVSIFCSTTSLAKSHLLISMMTAIGVVALGSFFFIREAVIAYNQVQAKKQEANMGLFGQGTAYSCGPRSTLDKLC